MASSDGSMPVTRPNSARRGSIPPVPQPISRIVRSCLPPSRVSRRERTILRRPTNHQCRSSWSSAKSRYIERSIGPLLTFPGRRSGRIIACPRVLIRAVEEPIFADHVARRAQRAELRLLPPVPAVGGSRLLAEGLRLRFRLEGGRDLRHPRVPARRGGGGERPGGPRARSGGARAVRGGRGARRHGRAGRKPGSAL